VEKDFSVYENGTKQNITFFTSDPFPLSAAVVLDLALSNSTWRKIRDTLPALVGAFSQYDEIALFTYGNTVRKVQDFSGIDAGLLTASLRKLKNETGTGEGAPVAMGPLSPGASPNTAGLPSTLPQVITPREPRVSYVLNDAILAAAMELSKREPTRRKILFVVSDGREYGSTNGFDDVRRVLLTYQIGVYSIGVGSAGVPIYRQLDKIHVPTQGYTNILPKYVSATGGQLFPELSQRAIEETYARVTEEARNQYTIGYNTPAGLSAQYRSIEVRVHRSNLKVYARDGYYPLPPAK
jgi:VWFA-related protein